MKRIQGWLLGVGIVGGVMLGAGNYRDAWLWLYWIAFAATTGYALSAIDDELARERFSPPSRGADALSLRIIRIIALAHVLVGAADSRFGWTHVTDALRAVGIAGFVACFLFMIAAMKANRFFSPVVRIQDERGHRVVDAGPYAIIRHPGYAAMIPLMAFSALALGSWIAFAVALVYAGLILRRVAFEDGFLRRHLAGYEAYTSRVRYRLLPGIW